ncbi:MAG TPA: DUF1667 domain-containing protein [Candidatus Hydrogenedentes bacterium]|nr:DUF1667 domain-containing protein [Candidatus Hydrogenedentota bacterium]
MTAATEQEIICLGCPNGCHLHCTSKKGHAVDVTGNKCDRGVDYGREELLDPKRVVTAVVKTTSSELPYVPVRTTAPLVKPLIPELLHELYQQHVTPPIRSGNPLIENFRNTGVNVIFTRSIAE